MTIQEIKTIIDNYQTLLYQIHTTAVKYYLKCKNSKGWPECEGLYFFEGVRTECVRNIEYNSSDVTLYVCDPSMVQPEKYTIPFKYLDVKQEEIKNIIDNYKNFLWEVYKLSKLYQKITEDTYSEYLGLYNISFVEADRLQGIEYTTDAVELHSYTDRACCCYKTYAIPLKYFEMTSKEIKQEAIEYNKQAEKENGYKLYEN